MIRPGNVAAKIMGALLVVLAFAIEASVPERLLLLALAIPVGYWAMA